MNIQSALRNSELESFCQANKIKFTRHNEFPNLVLFKYDSNSTNKFNCEARGLILDENDNWNIVSYPYDRFFNYGEKNSAKLDFANKQYTAYEKLDGSLMILYYYNGNWHVSTSGTPDASGKVNKIGKTFRELFWETFNSEGYELPTQTNICFMFELCLRDSPIVVPYPEDSLMLHGARYLTGEEINPNQFADKFRIVKNKPITKDDFEKLKVSVHDLNYNEGEGFIICGDDFSRVKLKSKKYIFIHDGLSVVVKSIKSGYVNHKTFVMVHDNYNEIVTYFPEFKAKFDKIIEITKKIIEDLFATYLQFRNIEDNRDFGLATRSHKYNKILFKFRQLDNKIFMDDDAKELISIRYTKYLCGTKNNVFMSELNKMFKL